LKNTITTIFASGRIPHASILVGPEGSASLPIALAIGKLLLCEYRKDAEACHTCASCLKAEKLIHPDLHFSFPFKSKDGEKADKKVSDPHQQTWKNMVLENPYSNLSNWAEIVDTSTKSKVVTLYTGECNNIIKKLSFKSYESSSKVMIIWMAELLDKNANRLLKLIEEPPENTFLILVVQDEQRMLNTVLSRCQILRIPPFGVNDIAQYLQTKLGMEHEASFETAETAHGNMNFAMELAQNSNSGLKNFFLNWITACLQNKKDSFHKFADEYSKFKKDEQAYLWSFGLNLNQHLLKYLYRIDDQVFLSDQESPIIKAIANRINLEDMNWMEDLYNENITAVRRYGNPKIICMESSLRLNNILTKR
jgi:DNA polymerase-3 subunit delta'